MAVIEGLRQVKLEPRHIDDACALVDEAGWNETAADWLMMMESGHAIGLEDENGRLVASALTMPYGSEFGWVSMVLVAGEWQRKGLASGLLRKCIAAHEKAGLVPVLDATPAGEKIYEQLGFTSHFTIQRWQCDSPAPSGLRADGVLEVTPDDLTSIIDYDRNVFEGNRGSVLLDIGIRKGAHGWMLEDGQGFLLSREGRRARQLGPLCADSDAGALSLMAVALEHFDEPVFVDVPDQHAGLIDMLRQNGFTAQRPFRRMFKGDTDGFGDIARTYALAGPEIG